MRAVRAAEEAVPVDRPAMTIVNLRVLSGSDPIAGELEHDECARPFTGWVELTRTLERLLSRGPGAPRATRSLGETPGGRGAPSRGSKPDAGWAPSPPERPLPPADTTDDPEGRST